MPVVPSVRQRGGGLGAVDRTRRTAADFGALEGAAVGNLGRAVTQTAQAGLQTLTRMENDQNESDVKRLQAEYDAERQRITSDLYNRKGIDAIEAEGLARKQLAKARSDILSRSDRRAVKEPLDFLTQRSEATENARMNRFISGERERDFIDTSVARIENHHLDAAQDPTVSGESRIGIISEVSKQADRLGWSAAQTKAEVRKQVSKMHSAVLDSVAAESIEKAVEYIEENRDDILPSVQKKYENALKEANELEVVFDSADSIVSQSDSEEEALELARQLEDPEVRKGVVSEVKAQFAEKTRFENKARNELASEVTRRVLGGENIKTIFKEDWATFKDLAQDKGMIARLMRTDKVKKERDSIWRKESDGSTYRDLKSLSGKELSDLNLDEFQVDLTQTEHRQLVNAQIAAGKELDNLTTNPKYVNAAIKEAKRRTTHLEWGKADDEDLVKEQNAILNELQGMVEERFTSVGEEPTPQEINDMATEVTQTFEDDGGAFDLIDFGGQTEEFSVASFRQMSSTERDAIEIDIDEVDDAFMEDIRSDYPTYFGETALSPDEEQVLLKAFLMGNDAHTAKAIRRVQEQRGVKPGTVFEGE